ncbi:hypothetical protein CYMTET_34680 [Cymbomonas tetramitiformis]|uniref:Uncharacterized protein n=1 Tax=Cymbomonas tetramitiformis TaxID=36881 RepID=A0AAE0FAS6_9CHLO|nr:hypothetical protein CYMTET_34680 [Cymbomonas tetramitiformis]
MQRLDTLSRPLLRQRRVHRGSEFHHSGFRVATVKTLARDRFDESVAKHVIRKCFQEKHERFGGNEANAVVLFVKLVPTIEEAFVAEDALFATLFDLEYVTTSVRSEANKLLLSTFAFIYSLITSPADGLAGDTQELLGVRFLPNVDPHANITNFNAALVSATEAQEYPGRRGGSPDSQPRYLARVDPHPILAKEQRLVRDNRAEDCTPTETSRAARGWMAFVRARARRTPPVGFDRQDMKALPLCCHRCGREGVGKKYHKWKEWPYGGKGAVGGTAACCMPVDGEGAADDMHTLALCHIFQVAANDGAEARFRRGSGGVRRAGGGC